MREQFFRHISHNFRVFLWKFIFLFSRKSECFQDSKPLEISSERDSTMRKVYTDYSSVMSIPNTIEIAIDSAESQQSICVAGKTISTMQ